MSTRRLLAAGAVAAVAFGLYRATMLPGVDFGDTGSFQATVDSPRISPRDAYPLYFAIGTAFVHATHLEPARALNLASVVEGALAGGALVIVSAELSGSLVAAIAAALLFVTSYTFWSQATIAEVYALHALLVATTMWLLLRWAQAPTIGRLATFFAVYALAFGNHLSMVLLLPGYTTFLLAAAPGGWRSMFRPAVVGLAVACAAAGAMQYAWNLRTLWFLPHPPSGLVDALQTFWFDVTKSDWRDTMVMNVPGSMRRARLAMYWFDLRQQFGPVVPVLALGGLAALYRRDRRLALLMLALYLVNVLFAFGYNVGDTHVFYLPSHQMIATLVAPALAALGRPVVGPLFGTSDRRIPQIVAALLIAYAGVRAYRDFPALDRSQDHRPTEILARLTEGLDDQHAILLTDLNWQLANGLSYYAARHPEVVDARLPDVLLYAPALIAANRSIGRTSYLTERARAEIEVAYGPMVPTALDPPTAVPRLSAEVAGLPPGTRYVLCVLRPARELPLDTADTVRAFYQLTGQSGLPDESYVAAAGVVGGAATVIGASHPFTRSVQVQGVTVAIRMESWLDFDTIRRMGFGHVIANRHHTLIVERGVSFVAFDDSGSPLRTVYRSNIFTPQPRYVCYR